jgi:hypothetical protein
MITHHQKTPAEEPEESDSNDEEIGNPIFGSDGGLSLMGILTDENIRQIILNR